MANGTIAFDTLSTSGQITGTAKSVDTDYVVNGSAKMWVNFTGVTTTAARDSFNISSLTDNGTGNTTVNINNNMGNANYSGCYFTNANAGTAAANFNNQHAGGFGSFATGSCQVYAYTDSAAVDAFMNLVGTFGDLA